MENTANAQSGAGVKEGAKAVRPQRSSTLSTASSASARSLRDPFGRTREDSSVYEWRKRDFHAGQEVRQQEKKRRRESLASRGVVAAEHRRVSARLRDEERARESSLVESRRLDGDALLEHRAEARQQARESLAKRGAQWRVQRSAEERLRQEERARSESLSEWRRMDWQEHDRYRRALVADNQRSIAGLLERWRAAKGCSVHAEVRARKVQAMVGGRGVEREEAERMVEDMQTKFCELESHSKRQSHVHAELARRRSAEGPAEEGAVKEGAAEERLCRGRVSLMLRLESDSMRVSSLTDDLGTEAEDAAGELDFEEY